MDRRSTAVLTLAFALAVAGHGNLCFPDKAVALRRVTDNQQHVEVVTARFADSAEPGRAWAAVETFEHAPRRGDPLYAVWARRAPADSASLC